MHITKGDQVIVLWGDGKGKTGKVLSVDPGKGMVVVEKIALRKRHLNAARARGTKATGLSASQGGQIIEQEAAIPACRVALVDKNGRPTRVRFEVRSNGEKVRVAATTGDVIERTLES